MCINDAMPRQDAAAPPFGFFSRNKTNNASMIRTRLGQTQHVTNFASLLSPNQATASAAPFNWFRTLPVTSRVLRACLERGSRPHSFVRRPTFTTTAACLIYKSRSLHGSCPMLRCFFSGDVWHFSPRDSQDICATLLRVTFDKPVHERIYVTRLCPS